MGSIFKAASESRKRYKEEKARRRGFHARRDGKPIRHNPYVRAKIGNTPKRHKKWKEGWKEANHLISEGEMEEYET